MGLQSLFVVFLLLPVAFLISLIPWKRVRNGFLMVLGGLFVVWVEPEASPLVAGMSIFTYGIGLGLGNAVTKEKETKVWKWVGVGLHLLVLAALKIAVVAGAFSSMPTGYSFFAFIAISYLMDIQRRKVPAEKNPLKIANYLLYFPRYISGPLARWKNFEEDSQTKPASLPEKIKGLDRFIVGLAKKILIADVIGEWLNFGIFQQEIPLVTTGTAWTMLLFFAIQLYYDFAGYTDMAIGLSQLFGIQLPENFNLPYTASSITDFWRRWHISLSNWFREYVFMPLEWKRRKIKWLKQWMNTLIVFLLTGLWHGVSLNFVIWGLIHGGVIVLEQNKKVGARIKKLSNSWQHVITLGIVLFSWVFFRSPSLRYALYWIKALVGLGESVNQVGYSVLPTIGSTVWVVFFLGVLLATGLVPKWWQKLLRLMPEERYTKGFIWAQRAFFFILLGLCIMMMTTTAVQPVIYGGF
ncbi:MAG: MBOAT family O-acyltransferase [Anaerolineae bacterium]|jgi:alginate O-acetyltransferase complex protein AlgI|nr:MBOAT family O-acyltransferase [Anaerolineae bacterium]